MKAKAMTAWGMTDYGDDSGGDSGGGDEEYDDDDGKLMMVIVQAKEIIAVWYSWWDMVSRYKWAITMSDISDHGKGEGVKAWRTKEKNLMVEIMVKMLVVIMRMII